MEYASDLEQEQEGKVRELRHRAMRVFLELGIRSVNMDDLSRELGISKKTLYKYFSDKRDLIQQCMSQHCGDMEQVILDAESANGNAIDIEMALIRFVHETTSQMHPSMLHDLRKYHPKAFDMVTDQRNELMLKSMSRNIRRGQKEGLYRLDIEPEVAAHFLVALGNQIKNMAQDPDCAWPLPKLFLQSVLYHIRAISTSAGAAYLESKIANEKVFQ